jgi:hypothetical protein
MDVAIVELQPKSGLQRESYQKIRKKSPICSKADFFLSFYALTILLLRGPGMISKIKSEYCKKKACSNV